MVLGGSALEPPKSALKFVLIAGSASQNTVLLGGFHSSEVEIWRKRAHMGGSLMSSTLLGGSKCTFGVFEALLRQEVVYFWRVSFNDVLLGCICQQGYSTLFCRWTKAASSSGVSAIPSSAFDRTFTRNWFCGCTSKRSAFSSMLVGWWAARRDPACDTRDGSTSAPAFHSRTVIRARLRFLRRFLCPAGELRSSVLGR